MARLPLDLIDFWLGKTVKEGKVDGMINNPIFFSRQTRVTRERRKVVRMTQLAHMLV